MTNTLTKTLTDTATIVEALLELPVATLAEATAAPCDLPPDIRPMVPRTPFVGTALTVRCPAGDNTAVTRAVDQARRGDVLVIDAGGTTRTAVWGETATYACKIKGVAGCVTNGAVRDIEEIRAAAFPVYAAAISLRGSKKGQPGEIGVALAIGDVVVNPGDFVCGGADGVVVIPRAEAPAVIATARAQRDEELGRNDRLKAGVPLAEILAEAGNRKR